MFHALISFSVWLIAYVILFGLPHVTVLFLPMVFMPLVLFIMGLSWALASLGVYLRDVSQLIGLLTTVMMFLSPVFYPVTALPEKYRHFLFLNPLTLVIEQARDVLFWGKPLNWMIFIVYSTAAAFVAWLGFAWFQKTAKDLQMSSNIAIKVENLSKCYHIYDKPRDRLMQMLARTQTILP